MLHLSTGTQMRYSQWTRKYSCTVSLVQSQDLNVTACSYQVVKALDACGSHMHADMLYSPCSLAGFMLDHNCTHASGLSSKWTLAYVCD